MPKRLSSFVCFDFETTGWSTENPSLPWQIGIARFSGPNFENVTLFDSLLHVPEEQVFNPYAPGRWAKLRTELSQAPALLDFWPRIHAFISTSDAAVAHHTATERGILNDFFPCGSHSCPWLDTVTIARVAYPGLPDYKLENLLPNLYLTPILQQLCPGRQAHDALYDAVACGVLLRHILSFAPWNTADAATLSAL